MLTKKQSKDRLRNTTTNCMYYCCTSVHPPEDLPDRRINIPFTIENEYACCWTNNATGYLPIPKPYYTDIPPLLQSHGIITEEWQQWVLQLKDINTKYRHHSCPCLRTVCFPCMCTEDPTYSLQNLKSWNSDLRTWQTDFNTENESKGVYAKLQSNCIVFSGQFCCESSFNYKKYSRWISITVTEEEKKILKAEEHLLGATNHIYGGLEIQYIMHP